MGRTPAVAAGPDEPQEETDRALLAATAAGDVAAFERLHGRLHGRLLGFARRLTDRHETAEEVVNDTMMVVWRNAGAFEGRSAVKTWIFGIAYRTARRALSREAPDRLSEELDEEMTAQSDAPGPEAVFDRQRLARAMSLLPVSQRATLELTYVYGYRVSEIAEITDCPAGTVKTRMFHARARLRKLLAGPDGEDGEGGKSA